MDTAIAPKAADPPARRALLDAGLQAFAAHGFEGAGTRAIAAAAGVNQGLIRHHFGSKEGLWRELVERGLAALATELERNGPEALLAAGPSGPGPHLALLQLIIHALLEPGARRDWLVRTQLEPLRRRALARQQPALPPNDALLLSWLGGALAPWLFGPALSAATGRTIAPWPHATGARKRGPWAPGGGANHGQPDTTGSTPTGAS